MEYHSQNKEDLFILNYFKGFKGRLLEIGANDGVTLSNSKLLIDNGWSADLVEPGSIFTKLQELYQNNSKVKCHNFAIGKEPATMTFYESGCHVKNGNDIGLVSTLDYEETIRWRKSGVEFIERQVEVKPYPFKQSFDFISIDAEGYDWEILQQIDLSNTKCLCIEWNIDTDLYKSFTNYCKGLKVAIKNAENLVFLR